MSSKKSASSALTTSCMSDVGIATELGNGKVRWRVIMDNTLKGPLITGTGAPLTCMCLSQDSEWLAFSRKNVGVSLLRLKGGDGVEAQMPLTNTGVSGTITSLHIQKSRNNTYTLYAGDSQGTLVSWEFKEENQLMYLPSPQVIHKVDNTGAIKAITSHVDGLYIAPNNGVSIHKIDTQTGNTLEEFPKCSSPPIRYIGIASHINTMIYAYQYRQLAAVSLVDKNKVQYLAGDQIPTFIDIAPSLYEQEYQNILAVAESTEIYIWKLSATSYSKKPIVPQCRIKLDPNFTSDTSIINARFSHNKPDHIIVAYGSIAKLSFAEVKYIDENEGIIANITVTLSTPDPSQNSANGASASSAAGASSNNTNAGNTKSTGQPRLVGSMDVPLPQATFKGADSLQLESKFPQDQEFIPFGQLIQKTTKRTDEKKSSSDLPRNISAVAALVSALSSGDKGQLNLVLSKYDEDFVVSTLQQLPVSQVLPLLQELLTAFNKKATLSTLSWTRHLLIIHQSYLATAPDLLEKLSGLYNTISDRLEHYPDLLKLSGRFELLFAHIREQDDETAHLNGKRALQTYHEDEDDLDMPESNSDTDSEHHHESDDEDFDGQIDGNDGDSGSNSDMDVNSD